MHKVNSLEANLWWELEIPHSLATNSSLSLGARHLYTTLLIRRRSDADTCYITLKQLAEVCGIRTKRSLRTYITELVEKGWVSTSKQPGPLPTCFKLRFPKQHRVVVVPASLICHSHLSPAAKCLYVTVAAQCRYGSNGISVDQAELAGMLGVKNTITIRNLAKQLQQTGWLNISRYTKARTYAYEPMDPHLVLRKSALQKVMTRLEREQHKGEALMKEMLNVVVNDDQFQDNARPGFLINPLTEERLEFDRWYTKANVAFEFNGPQHEKPTAAYPDMDAVRHQRARDLIKNAIARQRGIHIVTVQPKNLSFDWLIAQVVGRLPTRDLKMDDPVVRALENFSRSYVRRVKLA